METGKENAPPIIIVKKKGGHGGHHGGAWKVAFADFMTAMMAFFLVMWIIGQSDVVKVGIGGYFRDPVGFKEKVGMVGIMEGSHAAIPMPGPGMSEAERRREAILSHQRLKETGEEIIEALTSLPGLDDSGDEIEVELVDEGLRIRLMESRDSTFFDLGSADLAPHGMEVFSTIGRILAELDHDVILEGHTDSRAFGDNSYTNWELSSDRANTARRILEANGLAPERVLMVRAFSDRQLRYPAEPDDPRNRRVTIMVQNKFVDDRPTEIDLGERHLLSTRDTL